MKFSPSSILGGILGFVDFLFSRICSTKNWIFLGGSVVYHFKPKFGEMLGNNLFNLTNMFLNGLPNHCLGIGLQQI